MYVAKGPDPLPADEPVHIEFDREAQQLLMIGKEQTFARQHDGVGPLTEWVLVSLAPPDCLAHRRPRMAQRIPHPNDAAGDA